jgi:hypothetical protein
VLNALIPALYLIKKRAEKVRCKLPETEQYEHEFNLLQSILLWEDPGLSSPVGRAITHAPQDDLGNFEPGVAEADWEAE